MTEVVRTSPAALAVVDPAKARELVEVHYGTEAQELDDAAVLEAARAILASQQHTFENIELRPLAYSISKETLTFLTPAGQGYKMLDQQVVIYFDKRRAMFEKGEKTPICSSIGCVTGIPREGDERACATCPMNAWGSGVDETGQRSRGKACKEKRWLWLVPAESITEAAQDICIPMCLRIPTTSVRNWDQYCTDLAAHRADRKPKPLIPMQVLTTISLTKSERGGHEVAEVVFSRSNDDTLSLTQFLRVMQMHNRAAETARQYIIENDDETEEGLDPTAAEEVPVPF